MAQMNIHKYFSELGKKGVEARRAKYGNNFMKNATKAAQKANRNKTKGLDKKLSTASSDI